MKNSNRKYAILFVVPLSILGAVSVGLATRLGVGISADSTAYVNSATNFLAGRGFTIPMLWWLIRNSRIAGNATDRQIVFHPPTLRHAGGALSTLSAWLPPDAVPDVVGWTLVPIVVFILLAILFTASYLFRATAWIASAHRDGLGLTSTVWQ
jgi:hypothetical protein